MLTATKLNVDWLVEAPSLGMGPFDAAYWAILKLKMDE